MSHTVAENRAINFNMKTKSPKQRNKAKGLRITNSKLLKAKSNYVKFICNSIRKATGIIPYYLAKASGVGLLMVKLLVNIALGHVTIYGTNMIIYQNLTEAIT